MSPYKMEELLDQLKKECTSAKHKNIRESCIYAIDMLEKSSITKDMAAHRLRSVCLGPLKLVLENKSSRLSLIALDMYNLLITEDIFRSVEIEDEIDLQMTYQILQSLVDLPALPNDILVMLMKFLLQFYSNDAFHTNSTNINKFIEVCLNTQKGNNQVGNRNTVKGVVSQVLAAMCTPLKTNAIPSVYEQQECPPSQCYSPLNDYKQTSDVAFKQLEIMKVLKYCSNNITVLQETGVNVMSNHKLVLCLEAIYAIVKSLPTSIKHESIFKDVVWKYLCPNLNIVLGNPTHDKGVTSHHDSSNYGRGSGQTSTAPAVVGSGARAIYLISVELVRLVGSVHSMRTVLQSLFHKILLFPPPHHRLESLKVIGEMFSSCERVLDISGPPVDKAHNLDDEPDLVLLKLIIDSIQESAHSTNINILHAAVQAIVALLNSLDTIAIGKTISEESAQIIRRWTNSIEIMADRKFEERENDDLVEIISNQFSVGSKERIDSMLSESTGRMTSDNFDIDDGYLDVPLNDHVAAESDHVSDAEEILLIDMLREESGRRKPGSAKSSVTDESDEMETTRVISKNKRPKHRLDSYGIYMKDESNEHGVFCDEKKSGEDKLTMELHSMKTLPDIDSERQTLERRVEVEKLTEFNQVTERACAQNFISALIIRLPQWLALLSTKEVDNEFLHFAERFCEDLNDKKLTSLEEGTMQPMAILNADGVYASTYTVLLLTTKLYRSQFYTLTVQNTILSQQEFVENVHSSGVLVYLSTTWLSEVYRAVMSTDILTEGGYDATLMMDAALMKLLADIDGLGGLDLSAKLLHNASDNLSISAESTNISGSVKDASIRLSQIIFVACWPCILDVLSLPLNRGGSRSGCIALVLGSEGAKESTLREREAISMSLDGLRISAKLSCLLGVQTLCSSVFSLIADASCVGESYFQNQHEKFQLESTLHANHILSIDAILNVGLEVGAYCPDCWQHVFKCCVYVSQLEHNCFSAIKGEPLSLNLHSMPHQRESFGNDSSDFGYNDLNVSLPAPASLSVCEILKETLRRGLEKPTLAGGVLNKATASKAVAALSHHVDKLFDEAAQNLNLVSLLAFLRELRRASQSQLFSRTTTTQDTCSIAIPTMSSKCISVSGRHNSALHLFRMREVMLSCIRSKRPILHTMRCWAIIAPHFVEAACHRDMVVSMQAVEAIQSVLTEILTDRKELHHYNFHESLFKPFESMLRLELCDDDVQDQILSSICELVEGCRENIASGWKPLFGSLRAIKIHMHGKNDNIQSVFKPSAKNDKLAAPVYDIFDAFLSTDNVHIFSNAAIDCILCLLKFLRGSANHFEWFESSDNESYEGDSHTIAKDSSNILCIPALERLAQCSTILASIYTMTVRPMFRGSRSVKLATKIAPETQLSHGVRLPPSLEEEDDESGVLRVFYLLVDGLTSAVATCPKEFQPQTLDVLFNLLRAISVIPGPQFALFCITHLLLPMLREWLRRASTIKNFWDITIANFRHACGLTADLIVYEVKQFADNSPPGCNMTNVVKQMLELLIECMGQPYEGVARLGCACMRHLITAAGEFFTPAIWTIVCSSIKQSNDITLCFLKTLMGSFKPGSDDFNGDIGQVKVAARRDCTVHDSERLNQLARQVFLLDCQNDSRNVVLEDTRSFIFIILPPGIHGSPRHSVTIRVPLRNVIVGLVAHQLLLQIIGSLLLGKEYTTLLEHHYQPLKSCKFSGNLTDENKFVLFECLLDSYKISCEFDARPGLKFLLQKVCQLDVAANLYRQAGASFTFYVHALFNMVQMDGGFKDQNHIKTILSSDPQLEYHPESPVSLDDSSRENWPRADVISEVNQQAQYHGYEYKETPELSFDVDGSGEWIIKRMFSICFEVTSTYVNIHLDRTGDLIDTSKIAMQPLFLLVAANENTFRKGKRLLLGSRHTSEEEELELKVHHRKDSLPLEPPCQDESPFEEGSKLYSIATNDTIRNLMKEYKKRKVAHSRSVFVRKTMLEKNNELDFSKTPEERMRKLEIIKQQKSSLVQDSDARQQAWSEMVLTFLQLLASLPDETFSILLPMSFSCTNQLICHVTDPVVRQAVHDWNIRIARLYSIL